MFTDLQKKRQSNKNLQKQSDSNTQGISLTAQIQAPVEKASRRDLSQPRTLPQADLSLRCPQAEQALSTVAAQRSPSSQGTHRAQLTGDPAGAGGWLMGDKLGKGFCMGEAAKQGWCETGLGQWGQRGPPSPATRTPPAGWVQPLCPPLQGEEQARSRQLRSTNSLQPF